MSTASLEELKAAMRARLHKTGQWQKLRSSIADQVAHFLDEEGLPKPISSSDSKIQKIDSFFIQYLKSQGLHSTLSVFLLETGRDLSAEESRSFETVIEEIMQA